MAVLNMVMRQWKADAAQRLPSLQTPQLRRKLWLVVICGWVATAFATAFFIVLGKAVDVLAAHPTTTGVHLWELAACGLLASFFTGLRTLIAMLAGDACEQSVRYRVVKHFLQRGPARANRERAGAFISLVTDGAERVANFRQGFLADAIISGTIPIGLVIILGIVVDPLTALFFGLFLPIIPVFVVGFEKLFSKTSGHSRNERTELAASYLDALQGLETLSLFGADTRVGAELALKGEENRRSIMKLLAGNQLVLFVIDIAFSLLLLTGATGLALIRAESIGDAIVILGIALLLLEPMDLVGGFFYVGMGGMASQRAIRRSLTAPVPTDNDQGLAHLTEDTLLATEKLGFSYDDKPLFENVNLQVQRGDTVAIMGPSGEGKSTLLSILKGDLTPGRGSVVINGESRPSQLRAHSALVSQHTWLFTSTIADNLRLANPKASQDDMWQALTVARLADEVKRMPQGLETMIGEQGIGLSGGQAQRLSIARAVLSRRELLLLDEPTSQVDLASEADIIASLSDIAASRTIVMATHRESSLITTSKVLWMDSGKLQARQA